MASNYFSFPHPVLCGWNDDIEGRYTPSIRVTRSREHLHISARDLDPVDDGELKLHFDNGAIAPAVQVQCAQTYFRRSYREEGSSIEIEIPRSKLRGRVEVLPRLSVVDEELTDYQPEGLNSDYGDAFFDLERSDVVAVGPMHSFHEEKQFDARRAGVASIMRIEHTQNDEFEAGFQLLCEKEQLIVRMGETASESYSALRKNPEELAHSTVVFPALVQAIQSMDDYSETLWSSRLREILRERGINSSEPLEAAQALLENPMKRSADAMDADRQRSR